MALRSLEDEQFETLADLVQTEAHRSVFVGALARVSDPAWRAKLQLQVAACDRWIERYRRELAS